MSLEIVFDGLVHRLDIVFSTDWDLYAPVALVFALPDSAQRTQDVFGSAAPMGLPPGIDDSVWPGARAITVIPEGIAPRTEGTPSARVPTWSAFHRDAEGRTLDGRDLDFLRWLADWVVERFQMEYDRLHPDPQDYRPAIDLERVYVFGVGAGGILAYSLGWLLPRQGLPVHALSVYGSTIGGKRQSSEDGTILGRPGPGAAPTSVLAVHGTDDKRFVPENIGAVGGLWLVPYPAALSELVVDELVAEGVPEPDAEQIAPWDVVLRESVKSWAAILPGPAPQLTTSIVRGGTTIDVTYWRASSTYVVEATFAGTHRLPTSWSLPELVWAFFDDPQSATV